MSRTSQFLTALLMITLLGACGDSAQTDPPGGTAAPTESSAVTAGKTDGGDSDNRWVQVADLPETNIFGRSWTGDYDEMLDRRLIRVLTVYSAGRYYLDHGTEKGMTYELMKLFEQHVNKKHGSGHLKTHVVFIPVARNQLIPALLAGRGDIVVADLSITQEREELVDFTIPASKPVAEILITGPGAPHIESIEDLSGHTVYVRESSSYRESLDELNLQLRAWGRDPVNIEHVSELLEDDDLIEMVSGGLLPWAIVDDYKTVMWEEVFPRLTVRDDITFNTGARLAWAVRKDSPRLMQVANEFLSKHREGTLIGNVLKNRYVRDFDWAANALDRGDYLRFKELEGIFRSYGRQYGVDHLMIAAQGYQESRLDQSMRSSAGAIGVMQVLPSTASDPNVDIRNIKEVDANIHAGTKYLSYLRERYFSEPEITEADRTLLALAAYNTGPRRMINLRNRAKKLGYDPNVWFDNVEVVAAREVGREPVQYVANIYKYYISYSLAMQQGLQREEARRRVGIPAG